MTGFQQTALRTILDITIIEREINIINELKIQAVREQKYETAVELRQKELDLIKTMPTTEQLKLIRDNLDHIVNKAADFLI